ncbi:MAG TPA: hypothetical protein PLE19_00795 [Planctomycetota bacterium]|nr:hypothetical protein [Planctomycetota bacterium]HRR79685.1 hypothetical protein [Planctomycetota bacterium]HRT96206.1 hypothetical protein [Planctomycetota bacterium]
MSRAGHSGSPEAERFEASLTPRERRTAARWTSPAAIQAFLDAIPYSTEPVYRCPLRVLRDRRAHCFDGALFAAAALRRLGHPPLILELVAARGLDDVHLLALFRRGGHWGAVAKSNCVGLRFREPIYRSLRELALSYFPCYYNVRRQCTLRGYRRPMNLRACDRLHWMTRDEHLEAIADRLDRFRLVPLITQAMAAHLTPVDRRSYCAGLLGADPRGLFRPRRRGSHRGGRG